IREIATIDLRAGLVLAWAPDVELELEAVALQRGGGVEQVPDPLVRLKAPHEPEAQRGPRPVRMMAGKALQVDPDRDVQHGPVDVAAMSADHPFRVRHRADQPAPGQRAPADGIR